jgi:hypothetical protein
MEIVYFIGAFVLLSALYGSLNYRYRDRPELAHQTVADAKEIWEISLPRSSVTEMKFSSRTMPGFSVPILWAIKLPWSLASLSFAHS